MIRWHLRVCSLGQLCAVTWKNWYLSELFSANTINQPERGEEKMVSAKAVCLLCILFYVMKSL